MLQFSAKKKKNNKKNKKKKNKKKKKTGSSKEYLHSMFWAEIWKNIRIFYLKIFIFWW